MNDRQLQSFLVAARSRSFTQAAQELYITPTALIQQIRLLEDSIGFSLFHRTARGIQLTEAGCSFRETAETIMEIYREGINRGQNIARAQKGTLRIGLSVEDTPPFLIELCDLFRAKYPQIRLHFVRSRFECQIKDCVSDLFELFFFTQVNTLKEARLDFTPLYADETYLVMGKKHRLAGRESVTLEELEGETLYVEEMYEEREDSMLKAIRDKQLDIVIDNRPYDSSILLNISLEGGIMPSPKSWISNYVPPLAAVKLEGFSRMYGIAHQRTAGVCAQAFLQFAQEYFQKKPELCVPTAPAPSENIP